MNKSIIYFCFLVLFLSCTQKKRVELNLTKQGKKEGIHISYDSIGRLEIATYKNNLLDGEYILYHIGNQRIMRKEIYKNGLENGQAYYFYSNGSVQAQREWKMGKKIGWAVDLYETGEKESNLRYNDDGCLVARYTYDKSGNLINIEEAQGK